MTVNFDSESADLSVQPVQYFVGQDSSLKFLAPYISSYNFNGSIPLIDNVAFSASELKPSMNIAFNGGSTGDQYFPIISVSFDDELDDTPTNKITITYFDADNVISTKTFNDTDTVAVRYEDWENKDLGSLGWMITSGGNAIFSNVAVRGRIEALEGDIEGNLTVSGEIATSTTASSGGGISLNSSGLTAYNSSGQQTFNINADTGEVTIGGYAQDSDIPNVSGLVSTGQLQDNSTIISGGNIKTGTIQSAGFSTPTSPYVYDGSEFSNTGMAIVLGGPNAGAVIAKNFKITPSGDATFKGNLAGGSVKGGTLEIYDYDNYVGGLYGAAGIMIISASVKNYLLGSRTVFASGFDVNPDVCYVENNKYYGDGSQLTGISAGGNYQYNLSTTGPTDALNKIDGYVWYVY